MWNHNGTESRVLLPLWKEEEDAICATESIARMPLKELFRNGRKTREKLPLWGGGRKRKRKERGDREVTQERKQHGQLEREQERPE